MSDTVPRPAMTDPSTPARSADEPPVPPPSGRRRRPSRRQLRLAFTALTVVTEALMLKRRGYGLGGDVVVRCRRGHLYTTMWFPGASVTSVRLGWWRIQYCPVGRHVSLVTPVDTAGLDAVDRQAAADVHDLRLP